MSLTVGTLVAIPLVTTDAQSAEAAYATSGTVSGATTGTNNPLLPAVFWADWTGKSFTMGTTTAGPATTQSWTIAPDYVVTVSTTIQ